jgi:hypothetical protein
MPPLEREAVPQGVRMRRLASPNDCMASPLTLYLSWSWEKIDFRHSLGERSSGNLLAIQMGEAMVPAFVPGLGRSSFWE